MFRIKYQLPPKQFSPIENPPPFDIRRLNNKSWIGALMAKALRSPRWLLKILRIVWPVLKVGRLVVLTRADDVQEALTNPNVFAVPFGEEMQGVSGGRFILGMDNGAAYRAQKSLILRAFAPDQMAAKVSALCEQHLGQSAPILPSRFDAIQDVFKPTALHLCEAYFGLRIADKERFYESALAVSSFLFADIGGSKTVKELGVVGARYLVSVIDHSVNCLPDNVDGDETPLAVLVAAHRKDPEKVPLNDLRAIMLGMVLGFLPTTILGAGNALGVVLRRQDALNHVRAAVEQGDDKALDLALVEAMRFDPIQLGPFRLTTQDYTIAQGTKRERLIPQNSLVIPSTLSSMFDQSRVKDPDKFDPTRSPQNSMIFGHGLHSCIGAPMARAFSTQVFKAVFSLSGIKQAKKQSGPARLGIFPNAQSMAWDGSEIYDDLGQAMPVVVIPITNAEYISELQSALEAQGNVAAPGAKGSAATLLQASNAVHFVSAFICPAEEPAGTPNLVIEMNGDGDQAAVLETVAKALEPMLGSAIRRACGIPNNGCLLTHFQRFEQRSVGPLSTHLGLNFNGTPGHSVKRILKEQALTAYLAEALRESSACDNGNALDRLNALRSQLRTKDGFEWAFARVRNRLGDTKTGLHHYFLNNRKWWTVPLAVFLGFVLLNFIILGGAGETFWLNFWRVGAAISMTVVGGVLIIGGLLLAILAYLRWLERRDPSRFSTPSQDKFDAITAKENQIRQNHMAAVSLIKPSPLRMVLLRAVLWYIYISASYRNSPGELSIISTIHFARWVKIRGTRQLVFLSNYSGSWESYLEDFITKASPGLTSVWTNTVGFPRTRFLFQLGADLSEYFKGWARDQQVPTPFWFVAYPNLTTCQIRENALIREGFATINDVSGAECWLANFGSVSRPADCLDSRNIQSLVFGGLGKRLPHTRLLALSLPTDDAKLDLRELQNRLFSRVSFGEHRSQEVALQLAFSYSGLKKMGVNGQSYFANVFQQGMASRARGQILGDCDRNDPHHWLWGSAEKPIDMVALVYFNAADEAHVREVDAIAESITRAGAEVVFAQEAYLNRNSHGQVTEHFGFVDGISQPIIRGTRQSYSTLDRDQVVAPGEIVCGYPDERGNISPAPLVRSEEDLANVLPSSNVEGFAGEYKEFGYNGSFLVIRQLQQHTEVFDDVCESEAKRLRHQLQDEEIDSEWVAAKLIGRWRDGRPLVTSPHHNSPGESNERFRFQKQDPQGLACPLGSHIRRANPRDSLGEDAEVQIKLANRHRILRRGRSYQREDGKEKGILFMCLNADIERQFEFVQQTWLGSPNFERLTDEVDPLFSANCPASQRYTIPTAKGPANLNLSKAFVTTRGGGYFFLPGRQALHYLQQL